MNQSLNVIKIDDNCILFCCKKTMSFFGKGNILVGAFSLQFQQSKRTEAASKEIPSCLLRWSRQKKVEKHWLIRMGKTFDTCVALVSVDKQKTLGFLYRQTMLV